jgi:dolichol-phosphate mannosyltransferase
MAEKPGTSMSHGPPAPDEEQSSRPATHWVGPPDLSVVVPLFNEEENIAALYRRLVAALDALWLSYELVFVNDGSSDQTPAMLDGLRRRDPRVVPLHLSRNFGHQPAISAGLAHARGQAVIVMDGDLQDPPELLGRFIERWREGHEVVYAIRTERKENFLKRAGYFLFYRLHRAVSDIDIPLDSGDFCLMDRKVLEVLNHLPERMRFVRGLRTFVGFRQVGVPYPRGAREAGTPKYTFRALAGLALDGLFSFSSAPLKLVTYLGFFSAGLAILLLVWFLTDAWLHDSTPSGWASAIVVVLFTSAVQLLSLGVVGAYVRRIFLEVKGRPTYIVRDAPADEPALRSKEAA